jgi:indole-3-glycerol phosphate synthase
VRALSPDALHRMMEAGRELGIELLVEAHDAAELDLALEAGARLVGVNNRNLETLEIDPENAARLLRGVPADVVAVAESGVSSVADVQRAAAAGADAVLVGSSISGSADPVGAVRSLAGVRRMHRS